MEIGKVPNDVLKKIIFSKIKTKRQEVLLRPKIGEDCCAVDFGQDVCVLSSDPITGTVNEIGRLAVHISCNDVASCGVEPIGLIVTLLLPPGTTENELDIIMGQVCETADALNIDIMGGHTEVTSAVNRFVIISTAIGKVLKERLVTSSGAKPGDYVILTKSAGIEGTAIIASDREEELVKSFGEEFVRKAKSYINNISVLKEGVLAGRFGVTSMHDVTEGGVLGAVWEVAEASKAGVSIHKELIPVADETLRISEYYGIDPLKLISSGCMVITCSDGIGLVKKLEEAGIKATIIGRVTKRLDKELICLDKVEKIMPPESDELYKVK